TPLRAPDAATRLLEAIPGAAAVAGPGARLGTRPGIHGLDPAKLVRRVAAPHGRQNHQRDDARRPADHEERVPDVPRLGARRGRRPSEHQAAADRDHPDQQRADEAPGSSPAAQNADDRTDDAHEAAEDRADQGPKPRVPPDALYGSGWASQLLDVKRLEPNRSPPGQHQVDLQAARHLGGTAQ